MLAIGIYHCTFGPIGSGDGYRAADDADAASVALKPVVVLQKLLPPQALRGMSYSSAGNNINKNNNNLAWAIPVGGATMRLKLLARVLRKLIEVGFRRRIFTSLRTTQAGTKQIEKS